MMIRKCLCCVAILLLSVPCVDACTSMIVGAKASATGRPLLWKNRDTSHVENFVAEVQSTDGGFRYIALFNAGDCGLREAWTGLNEKGFAIMNTVAYNLPIGKNEPKDREGLIMSEALKRCVTVDDFAALLDSLPHPLGAQTCFGVIDADGNGAYFEVDNYKFARYDLSDSPTGVLTRTNYAFSGKGKGSGYVRYDNVQDVLGEEIECGKLSPQSFTDVMSRSFWRSTEGVDFAAKGDKWVVDNDFVPRYSTSASVVVEGVAPDEDPALSVMWTELGYPPCSYVVPAMVGDVPEELLPSAPGCKSPMSNEVMKRKANAFSPKRKDGKRRVDMEYLKSISAELLEKSAAGYKLGYEKRAQKSQSQ